MGRWGENICDSDTVLDMVGDLTAMMNRELAFWYQPEQLPGQHLASSYWVANVLAVVEMMLLLDQHETGRIYIEYPTAVTRWRETFLEVWDSDWDNTKPALNLPQGYATLAYRQQHRAAIVTMFDRLESIAQMWASSVQSADRAVLLVPLLPDYPLPYFSNSYGDNRIHTSHARFVSNILEYLVQLIIYRLSPEMRPDALTFNVEEVWGAVDILGFLSIAYDVSLVGRTQIVQTWQETTILIWKQFRAGCKEEWNEGPLYRNILAAFERLKEITAKKQSDSDWLYSRYDSLDPKP